jgi:hypothetical protein
MGENKELRQELENKAMVLKQLEGVYNTSGDKLQKRRVLKEIEDVKQTIKGIKGRIIVLGIENDLFEEENINNPGMVSVLNVVRITKYREDSRDREIDAVTSYMEFFEKNYLSILSEYHIKLDFNHSIKRDVFYPRFMEIKKILKEYDYELDVLNREEYNNIAFYRDKSIIHKIKHRYLLSLDRFFKDLRTFLNVLVDDFDKGGIVILHPQDFLSFSEFEKDRRFEGHAVIDAIKEMYLFSDKFTRFLGLPNM